MLRVSIHAGPYREVSRFNRLAWLEIGYEKLEPVADYKILLFQAGVGATMPLMLTGYPRWSASLWDLTARGLAMGLNAATRGKPEETIPAISCKRKRCAFATEITALIEHMSVNGMHKNILGYATIRQTGKYGQARSTYLATFTEHTMPDQSTLPFKYAPDVMKPAELLLHACLMRLTGKLEIPPRPGLCVPKPVIRKGQKFVAVHRLVEPARTGFLTWLNQSSDPPLQHRGAPQGIVSAGLYAQFLMEAI